MSLKTTSRKLISLLMTVVMLLSMFQPFALAEGETAEDLTAYDGTKAEIIAGLVLTGYDAQTRTLSFDANVSAESKDTIDYIYNSVTGKLYDSSAERGGAIVFGDIQTGSGGVIGNFEVVLEDSENPADILDELILKIYVDGKESGIEVDALYDPEMISEEGETGNGPQQAGGFTPLSTPDGVGTGHAYPNVPGDMTSNVPGISAARGQFPAAQYYSETDNAFTLTTGSGALVFNIVYNIATSGDWTDGYFLVIQIPESSEVWESTETNYKVKTVFSNNSAYNSEDVNFVEIGRVENFFADGKDAYVYATWFDHDDANLGERLMVRDNLRFEFNNGYTPNGYGTEVAAYFYPAKLPADFDVNTDIDAGYCAADYLELQMTGAVRAMYGKTNSQDDVIAWYPSATITAVSEYPVGTGPDALYTINAALNGGTTSMTVPTERTYADVYGSVTGTKTKQSFTYKVDIDTPLTDTLRGRVFLKNASVDVALSGFKNTPDGKPVSVVVSKAASGANPIANTYDGGSGNFSFDISGTELSPLSDTRYYIIVTYNKDPYTVMNDMMLALSEVSSANPDRLNGGGTLVATSLSAALNYTPVTDSKKRTVNTAAPAELAFGYTQAAPALPTLTFETKINVSGTVSAYDTAKRAIYPAASGGLEYKLYTSGGTHVADGVIDTYGNTTLNKAESPAEDYQLAIGEYYLKINGGIAGFESVYYQANQIMQSAQNDYRILIKVDDPDGDGSPRVQIDYTPDTAGDWELQPSNWAFTYASQSKTTVMIPIERQAFGQSAAEWANMRADFPYTSAIQSTAGITMVSMGDAGAVFNNTLTTWSSEQTNFTLNPTVTYDSTFAYALFEGVPVPSAGNTYTFSVIGGLTSILDSGITYNYIADQAVTVTIGSDAWAAPVKADQTLKFKSNKGGFKVGKVFVDDKAALTEIVTNVGAVTIQFDLYKMDETGTTVIDTSAPTYTDVRISGTVNDTNKWIAPMEAKHYGGTAVGSSEFESGYYAIVETGIYKGINTGAAITGAAIDTTNNTVDGEYPLVGGTAANIIKVQAVSGSYDSLPTGAVTLVTNGAPNSIPDGALIADSQYGTMKIQSFGANTSGGGFALPGMTYNIYKAVTGTRETTPLLANVAQTSAGETVLRLPAGQYVIEWVTNNPWLLLGTGTTNGFSFVPALNNTSTMTVLANVNHGGSANITFNDSMVDIDTSSSQRTTAFLFGKMPRIEGTKINKTTSVALANADFLVYFKKNGTSDYVMLKNGGTPVTTNGGVPGASTAVTGTNGKFWHEVAYSATGDYVGEYLLIEYIKPGKDYKDPSYLAPFLGAGTTVGSVDYKDTVASSSITGVYSQIPKAAVSGSKYGVENSAPAYNPQLVSAGNAENTLLVYFDAHSRYAQTGVADFAGSYQIVQYNNWGVDTESVLMGSPLATTYKTTEDLEAHFYVDPGYTYIITQTSISVGNAVNNTGDIIAVRVNDDGTVKVLIVTDLSELDGRWQTAQLQPASQNVKTSADALITRTGFTTAQGSVTVYFGNLKIPDVKFIKYGQTENEETYWDNEAQQILTRPEEQLLTGAKFVIFYIGEDDKAYFIAQTTDPVLGTMYTLLNPSGYAKSDIGLDGGDGWKKADAKTVKQKLFGTNNLYDTLGAQSAVTGVFAVGADSKMILPNLPVNG
ncbi:MAG: hypothetical protein LBT88_06810, partial [Oscillospiraceae bacterium]|nr:hypothetical protein [Oscillospiraceae bacterium]